MLFFNLYEQSSVIVTLFSAICLFFATFYASKVRYKKGLIYFLIGFVLLVTSSQLQQNTMYFYAYAVSVRTIVFVELLLVVLGTLCLIVSSGYILLKKALETMLLFLFISIGILLAVYAVFIADNANIVADI